MPNAKAWYKIIYDLAVGSLITVFFYLLVVRLPDYQRRQRLKRSLERHYKAFREDCHRDHAVGRGWRLFGRSAGDSHGAEQDTDVENLVITGPYRGAIYGLDAVGVTVRGNAAHADNSRLGCSESRATVSGLASPTPKNSP
jgi:hypothetical protein